MNSTLKKLSTGHAVAGEDLLSSMFVVDAVGGGPLPHLFAATRGNLSDYL
jgi:hypothetical protein